MSWGLFKHGQLVDLDVRIWSGAAGLRDEDLGLVRGEAARQVISLGRKRLVLPRHLEGIRAAAGEAQRALEAHTLDYLRRGLRFVPERAIADLVADLERAREEFDGAVRDFLSDYARVREEMRPLIEQAAREVFPSDDDGRARFLRLMEESYPGSETLRGRFSLTWAFEVPAGPDREMLTRTLGEEEARKVLAAAEESAAERIRAMTEGAAKEVTDAMGRFLALAATGAPLRGPSYERVQRAVERISTDASFLLSPELAQVMTTVREEVEFQRMRGQDGVAALRSTLEQATQEIQSQVTAAAERAAVELMGEGRVVRRRQNGGGA